MGADQEAPALTADVSKEVVYVSLLDEGVPVSRPTTGVKLRDNVFLLEATADYDPEDETWEFPPGSIVVVELMTRSNGPIKLAVQLASERHAS